MLIFITDCHPDVLNFLSINSTLNLATCPWGDADLRKFLNDPPVTFEGGTKRIEDSNSATPVEIR